MKIEAATAGSLAALVLPACRSTLQAPSGAAADICLPERAVGLMSQDLAPVCRGAQ